MVMVLNLVLGESRDRAAFLPLQLLPILPVQAITSLRL